MKSGSNVGLRHDLHARQNVRDSKVAPVAITIGNFDGVHRGHVALIEAARAAVGSGTVIALAFDPHPLAILRPDAVPARLSTFAQRSRWLKVAGADEVVRLEPTCEFLNQTSEAFLEWIVERWKPGAIVEGPDFRFGHHRAGSIDTLRGAEQAHGFRTVVVDPVEVSLLDQSVVRASSSLARWLIERGRVGDAHRVLGRPYELEGVVERGEQRGRALGFPTANVRALADDQLLPGDGVYAGCALRVTSNPQTDFDTGAHDARTFPAAISIGTKSTFGEHARACEAHLLDYDGGVDDYGWSIRLQFAQWLRDQVRYDSAASLIAQLGRDVANVRTLAASDRASAQRVTSRSPTNDRT